MVVSNRWILPDGVVDVLPAQAQLLEAIRGRMLKLFDSWGYDLVIPPMLEFTDSLHSAAGEDLELLTFRTVDPLSGKTMGVRPDITPQIARIDAHSLRREGPARLCYAGTVLHTRARDVLSSRTPISIGLELFGETSISADIEVVRLFLKSLAINNIQNICLDLGHVDICRGLLSAANLGDEKEAVFFDLLRRKAAREVGQWVSENVSDEKLSEWLLLLPNLTGGIEILDLARQRLQGAPKEVIDGLDQLEAVASAVSDAGARLYFDLGESPGYGYHTGLVFAAYISGYGKASGTGGRYDYIGAAYGRSRPATGFAFDLDSLMNVSTEDSYKNPGICFSEGHDAGFLEEVDRLRTEGERVIQVLSAETFDLTEINCDRELVMEHGQFSIKKLS